MSKKTVQTSVNVYGPFTAKNANIQIFAVHEHVFELAIAPMIYPDQKVIIAHVYQVELKKIQ